MNIFPKFISPRKSLDDPRLYPASGELPGEAAGSEFLEECDRSYDDALSDMQFSRFLHSEYDAQAPAGSFERLMLSIEEHEKQKAAAPRTVLTRGHVRPTLAWASSLRAALRPLTGPLAGRLVSGVVAVMLVAVALGPNLQAIVRDASLASLPASSSVRTEHPAADQLGPRQLQYLQSAQIQVYDRAALLQRDPPDTLMPPHRDLEYVPSAGISDQPVLTELIPRKE